MKTILHCFFSLVLTSIVAGTTSGPATKPADRTAAFPLCKTAWGQRDRYAAFTPDRHRLGCWSTAIAQILYHHRLTPSGNVSYKCRKGYAIREDLGSHTFDWARFVNEFDDKTPNQSLDEVAKYIYFTSVVVQKEFGTGTYRLSHAQRAAAVARHYKCEARLIDGRKYPLNRIKQIVVRELDGGRPVMMHLRDRAKKRYHAVAVDGYRLEDRKLMIHINMGHQGKEDAWYDFDGPVTIYDDLAYREIMTIKPRRPAAKGPARQ